MRRAFPLSLAPSGLQAGPGEPQIAAHWRNVQRLPGGEGINAGLMEQQSFSPPSSLPELLALKAAEHQGAAPFNHLYQRLQEAYFVEARNIGDPIVLEELADAIVPDMNRYRRELAGDALEREVRADYEAARARGVRGTPSVIPGERDRVLYLLGYAIPIEAYRVAVESLLVAPMPEPAR